MAETDDERTTAAGLFHFAESYRTCAEALMRSPPKSLRFDDPLLFLAYHSLELYLKAYLRGHGSPVSDLKTKFLHSLTKAWDAAEKRGLKTRKNPRPLFQTLDAERTLLAHRYIVTGISARPDVEELVNFIEEVRYAVFASLDAGGHPIRFENEAENGWSRS